MKPVTTGLLFFLVSLYVYIVLSIDLFASAQTLFPYRFTYSLVGSAVLAFLTGWFVYRYESG